MSEHCIRADGLGKTFPLAHPPLTLFQHLARASRRQNTAPLNALTDVNFQVARGEWIGIVGNNGSGKTAEGVRPASLHVSSQARSVA